MRVNIISKSEVKIIASLKLKKHRQESGQFVVEGEKVVGEALASGWPCLYVCVRADWYENHPNKQLFEGRNVRICQPDDLARMSQLSSPSPVLAVMQQNAPELQWKAGDDNFVLVVDQLRDPGNLGTMVRIADWFGLAGLVCSPDTVELWNAKTIQASMGSVFRMPVLYTELTEFVQAESPERVFATVLQGTDIRKGSYGPGGLVLIGSESFGLSPALAKLAGHKLTIPAFGRAESLNAAVATGIVCSWLRA